MAIHTDLPIYKTAYDLLDKSTDIIKNMPRDFKVSIGAVIRDECIAIMVLMFRANVAQDKSMHLVSLIERLQVAELMIRLSKDKRLISVPQYAALIELTGSIGKQATAWRKALLSPVS